MKIASVAVLAFFLCGTLSATQPFPPRVFAEESFCYVVGFPWPDQQGKVLVIRTSRKTILLGLEEIGLSNAIHSTAGSTWYREAIGYVGSFKTLHSGFDSTTIWGFYFRNESGYEFVISLPDGKILNPALVIDRSFLDRKTTEQAEKLTLSSDPHIRRAGAIHLGQLGGRSSLETLRPLLDDNASHTLYSGKDAPRTVYFVREVAKEAIHRIQTKADTKSEKRKGN